jgi:hypothetical protein
MNLPSCLLFLFSLFQYRRHKWFFSAAGQGNATRQFGGRGGGGDTAPGTSKNNSQHTAVKTLVSCPASWYPPPHHTTHLRQGLPAGDQLPDKTLLPLNMRSHCCAESSV